MRNFVIINGVNSNTINGLGINELPPITKPEMRNIREEIDGRDGDIITNLGYSAYDKTITIGLFGTGYDINNIVAFFNGEGTIVFSNEPDKYYNFKILNQIDYESLQKFKTASITFHCQPFKYPLSETPLEIEYDYIEDEGETLTLNNTGNSTLKLDLKGNTSQSGTPTPTSPIPVSVVSGDNDVVVCGKNLLQITTFSDNTKTKTINGITATINSDGTISMSGSASANTMFNLTKNDFTLSGAFYYSCNSPSANARVELQCRVDGATLYLNDYGTGNKRTANDSFVYDSLYIVVSNGTNVNGVIFKPMVALGTIVEPYEPYTSQTYEVDLGELELCKIGTYQDYLYKDNGKWYLHKEIGKVVLNGSETWNDFFSTQGFYRYIPTIPSLNTTDTINCICDYYKGTTRNEIRGLSSSANNKCSIYGTELVLVNTSITSINNFKTWLQSNNTTVYYVLATPYLSLIEDNNLIEQLDNLQNAMSYEGTTNISQTNNDKPFIISAKALEKGTNEVVVNNIGNVYSKPLIALEGSGNVDIYLDNTQILKANVESKMNIDIAQLEAYNPDTSALLNRQVIGNYNSMTLQPGNNTIRIDGALTKATITNYTRWL